MLRTRPTSSMARSRGAISKNHGERRRRFISEKRRIENHFPCFKCELRGKQLVCYGQIIPSEGCEAYKIKIEYSEGGIPKVYVTEPHIEPNSKYHIFMRDGDLCLYDHRESAWTVQMFIHETIIPWTAEWLVFYELWKLTGKWLGPEASHGTAEKKPAEVQY